MKLKTYSDIVFKQFDDWMAILLLLLPSVGHIVVMPKCRFCIHNSPTNNLK